MKWVKVVKGMKVMKDVEVTMRRVKVDKKKVVT